MNNNEIKRLIKREADNIRIKNVYNQVTYASCNFPQYENIENNNHRKQKTSFWAKLSAAAVSICLVIALIIFAPTIFFDSKVDAKLSIDINPGITVELNKNNRVVNATASNDEGKQIIDGIKLKKLNYEKAVELIIDKAIEKEYIEQTSEENAILFSYTSNNDSKKEIMLNKVKEIAVRRCEKKGIRLQKDNLIIEEIITEQREKAEEYHISPAKYRFIEKAYNLYDGDLSKEEFFNSYKDKSIREINQFIKEKQNKGNKRN